MRDFSSSREMVDYYLKKYGHFFHPPRDFNDLVNQWKKIGEIDPEDALPRVHTWKLVEDYENRFIASYSPTNDVLLIYEVVTHKQAGKFLKERSLGSREKFYEFPKVKAPKEKEEITEIPEVKEEEKEIFIDEIYIPSDYSRIRVNPNRVNEIAMSMKEIGQTDPIIVVPIDYGKNREEAGIQKDEVKKYKYVLIKGLHRLKAKKLLNQFYIKAIIKYNDYEKERDKSFVENVLLKKLSAYEQSLEFDRDIKLGKSEREIAKKKGVAHQWISDIKRFAKFKNDFGEKHYVLTILTYGALDKLYLISLDPDPRQYNFIKKKIIEAFEKGVRKIKSKHIFEWCKEYIKPIEEKEIQKKIIGEEIEVKEAQQVQMQIEKPISKIPKKEEVKKKGVKKTPEEQLERKVDSYSSSFPKDIAQIWKKYAKSNPVIMKKYLTEYRRNCVERIIKEGKLTHEDIERIFKEEAKKFE
ncbi:MAG: ParB/RepB/Spo0J family partition protein [Nitrososphaerota archaeon]